MIQAAFLLDEATYFAHFTGRYVRTTPRNTATPSEEQLPAGVKRIKSALLDISPVLALIAQMVW
jgi:hypothetical protein